MIDHAANKWVKTLGELERDAHQILGSVERSKSRIVALNAMKADLDRSSNEVRESFADAVLSLEQGIYRGAIVLSWSGFFYQFCSEFFVSQGEKLTRYKKWDIRELSALLEKGDAEILEAAHRLGFISKSLQRTLDGHLATRNRCAHPSGARPSQNQAIGFVDEMLSFAKNYHSA